MYIRQLSTMLPCNGLRLLSGAHTLALGTPLKPCISTPGRRLLGGSAQRTSPLSQAEVLESLRTDPCGLGLLRGDHALAVGTPLKPRNTTPGSSLLGGSPQRTSPLSQAEVLESLRTDPCGLGLLHGDDALAVGTPLKLCISTPGDRLVGDCAHRILQLRLQRGF